MIQPLIAAPGPWEIVLILLIIVLLFGAKKLPELARGSGRALRIFKAETKGLIDDDEDEDKPARPVGELNQADTPQKDVLDAEQRRDSAN
ncbi:MAG TPA: Sec-independent protein translocase subunit TatA [Nocardioides sp.]